MFLELRNKLVVFDRLSNPFRRRGLLRLADRHPRAYLTLTLSLGLCGYLFLLLFPALVALTMIVAGGVVLAETRKAAESVIEAFMGLKQNILIQEFIKEAGGADIRCLVVGGKVVAAMKRQAKAGEFRSNLHRGGVVCGLHKIVRQAIVAVEVVGVAAALEGFGQRLHRLEVPARQLAGQSPQDLALDGKVDPAQLPG